MVLTPRQSLTTCQCNWRQATALLLAMISEQFLSIKHKQITTNYIYTRHSKIHQGAVALVGSATRYQWHASGAWPKNSCSSLGHGTSPATVPPLVSTAVTLLLCWINLGFGCFVWPQLASRCCCCAAALPTDFSSCLAPKTHPGSQTNLLSMVGLQGYLQCLSSSN